MERTPKPGVTVWGDRSVAAETISGTVATGDHARLVTLGPGAIPAPEQVAVTGQVSSLPRTAARVFKGRDAALAELGRALAGDASVVVTQAVYGLGGVGKSELALHYAHARRGDYRLVWWVTADSAAQIETGLAALAARLCPPIAVAGSTEDAAGWALGWLQAHDRWLLVLDNVEDPRDVEPVLGQLSAGHIVLTTRRDVDWQRLAVPIRLDILDPGAAAEVITARTGHATGQDRDDAAAVAAELGFLPLALDQAAACMIQARLSPGQYLARLRQHPARMYTATAGQAQQTITRVWDITIEALRRRDPDVIRLLQILACYAPDNIPRRILADNDAAGPVDEQLGLLASYSMITLTADTVSIHRLVQAVILGMPETHAYDHPPADTALAWLDKAIPPDPVSNMTAWPLLRALAPHAESISSHYPDGQQPQRLAMVQKKIGFFCNSQGDYERALVLRESVLRILQAQLGPGHPYVATALDNLAVTYRELGRAADALALQERALRITETALGPDHHDVAIRLGNLALTYSDLHRAAEALLLEERALRITETALGPRHPIVAIRLGNLAGTYRDLGRLAGALPLQERALRITETALGPDHPDVAIALACLAGTYRSLGRAADALPLSERALRITETSLGPDHPEVANRLGNLALTYDDLGRAADALPLIIRAVDIRQAIHNSGRTNA